jgi:hypothetical protein
VPIIGFTQSTGDLAEHATAASKKATVKNIRKEQGRNTPMIFLFITDVRHYAKYLRHLNPVVYGHFGSAGISVAAIDPNFEIEFLRWRSAAACSRHRLCRVLAETEFIGVPTAARWNGRAVGKFSAAQMKQVAAPGDGRTPTGFVHLRPHRQLWSSGCALPVQGMDKEQTKT